MNEYGNIYVSRTNMLTQHTANNAFKIRRESNGKLIIVMGPENFKENEKNINCWRCMHIFIIKWVRTPTLVKSHETVFFPNVFSRL